MHKRWNRLSNCFSVYVPRQKVHLKSAIKGEQQPTLQTVGTRGMRALRTGQYSRSLLATQGTSCGTRHRDRQCQLAARYA